MVLSMNFSPSTFTIEIGAIPTVAFQAKWQADADQICKDWLRAHWDELSSTGPGGIELPPVFKLRLARTEERAAYEAEGTEVEFCREVKIVRLHEASQHGLREAEPLGSNGLTDGSTKGLTPQHDDDDG